MVEVECGRLSTITATAGETYKLSFENEGFINLHNDTAGAIHISDNAEINTSNSVFIEAGGGYSDLYCNGVIYIKADEAGSIQIVTRG